MSLKIPFNLNQACIDKLHFKSEPGTWERPSAFNALDCCLETYEIHCLSKPFCSFKKVGFFHVSFLPSVLCDASTRNLSHLLSCRKQKDYKFSWLFLQGFCPNWIGLGSPDCSNISFSILIIMSQCLTNYSCSVYYFIMENIHHLDPKPNRYD